MSSPTLRSLGRFANRPPCGPSRSISQPPGGGVGGFSAPIRSATRLWITCDLRRPSTLVDAPEAICGKAAPRRLSGAVLFGPFSLARKKKGVKIKNNNLSLGTRATRGSPLQKSDIRAFTSPCLIANCCWLTAYSLSNCLIIGACGSSGFSSRAFRRLALASSMRFRAP